MAAPSTPMFFANQGVKCVGSLPPTATDAGTVETRSSPNESVTACPFEQDSVLIRNPSRTFITCDQQRLRGFEIRRTSKPDLQVTGAEVSDRSNITREAFNQLK